MAFLCISSYLSRNVRNFSRTANVLHRYCQESNYSAILNSKKATNTADIFTSYGFTKGQISHIFNSHHTILCFSKEDLLSNLNVWQEIGLHKKLLTTLTSHPELLTLSPDYIKKRIKDLATVFTNKDIDKLLVTCPNVFLDDFEIIEEKVKYIIHSMGVEQKSIVKCEALEFPLVHIKCRHLFLTRAGFYKIKKKAVISKTPPLSKVFARNMNTFLKLSGLSEEEYNTFIAAYEFEEIEKLLEDSDEEC